MTTFGKILVFINLVFSLVVCALIIMVFITKTNWADYGKKLGDQNDSLSKSNVALSERERTVMEEAKGDVAKANAAMAKADEELKAAQKTLETARTKEKDLLIKVDKADAGQKKLLEDVAQKTLEVKKQEEFLARAHDRLNETIKSLNAERDQKVNLQIENRKLKSDNNIMYAKLEELQKENLRSKQVGTSVAGKPTYMPPPENVEGVIKNTDTGGLVTLSIGSDSGIQSGHTLEVWRTDPAPLYLGTIRVTNVRANEAVAQPLFRMKAPLQPGDRVANKIPAGG